MDFEQTSEGAEAAELAGAILAKHCTAERLKEIEAGPARFDHDLWRRFADSGLIALTLPEDHNGSGLGILELASLLVEVGRKVAPMPLGVHAVTSMALAAFASQTQQARWLPGAGLGEFILTTALSEDRMYVPEHPVTRADNDGSNWLLTGSKAVVPAGPLADLFVVPAETSSGLTVFLVHGDDPGVAVVPQNLSGQEVAARLELDRAVDTHERVLGTIGEGAAIVEWLSERLTVAVCAEQLGVLEGALALTAEYAKTREQFDRPIGTFQAVSQRLADAYIDVLGARLTMWQAAWLISETLPATQEIAVAKLWAADAGHRVAHTTVHVHGGVGIDLDGEAHRYFTGGWTEAVRRDQARAARAASTSSARTKSRASRRCTSTPRRVSRRSAGRSRGWAAPPGRGAGTGGSSRPVRCSSARSSPAPQATHSRGSTGSGVSGSGARSRRPTAASSASCRQVSDRVSNSVRSASAASTSGEKTTSASR